MSTMGAKVHWTPFAAASVAAIRAARSTALGSKLAASARGTGKMVRNPWITSWAKSSGMPRRDSSTATRCIWRVSSAPYTPRKEPTLPERISASPASETRGPVIASPPED